MSFETFVRIDQVVEELPEDVELSGQVFTFMCAAPNNKGKIDSGYSISLGVGERGRGWFKRFEASSKRGVPLYAYVVWERQTVSVLGGNVIGQGELLHVYFVSR